MKCSCCIQCIQVRKITFTGSTAVGKKLMAGAAGTVKRVCTGYEMRACANSVESARNHHVANGLCFEFSRYLWNLVAMHPA